MDAAAVVAPPRAQEGGGWGCGVCALSENLRQQVNAAIWTPERTRAQAYRANALRVIAASGSCDDGAECDRFWKEGEHGRHMDAKVITRHAEHTEISWRLADAKNPPSGAERPVFPVGFGDYADRSAEIGMKALETLAAKIERGWVEDRDLVSVAKLGGAMMAAKQKHEDTQRQQPTLSIAIMGLVSGHLEEPAGEVKNVTPVPQLMAALREERAELEVLQGFTENDGESDAP